MDCIFCRIASGSIPADIVYQDEEVIAFRDIEPQAPVHLIIIPRRHIPSLLHLSEADLPLIGHLIAITGELAKSEGTSENGYRLVISCGEDGGQVVPHLHMHLLGGRRLADELG